MRDSLILLAINLLVKFGVMLFKSTDSLLDRQREKDRRRKCRTT